MKAPHAEAHSHAHTERPKKAKATATATDSGPMGNWSKLPNEYLELIMGEKLSGPIQRDLILLILFHTWGIEKKEWARISLGKFSQLCHADAKAISRNTIDLENRGIIATHGDKGCSTTTKLYKLTPERWKDAPRYEPKPIQTATEAETQEDSDESEAAPRRRSNGDKLLVRPHKRAACVPIRMARKDREPVEFQIQYLNEGETPFEVSATTEADILQVTFSSKPLANKSRKTIHFEMDKEKAKVITPIQSNQQDTRFDAAITSILSTEFGKGFLPDSDKFDAKFRARILAAAGPDLTPEAFQEFAIAEIRAMRKVRKPVQSGILRALAEQAAKALAKTPPPSPAPTQPDHPEDLDAFYERMRLEDPEGYEIVMRQGRPA
jgi:hypothetical protein